jgi:hypothetical protein
VFLAGWLANVSQTYGPLVTSGAIFVSAAVAVGAIVYNVRTARKRATIDLVMHLRQNNTLVEAKKKVLALHENNAQFSKYALKENSGVEENNWILEVLNAHEFVAAGIRQGAFDEQTYKRMQWSVLVRDWAALETYVMELRNSRGRPTLYQEFQWLAKKWNKKSLKTENL